MQRTNANADSTYILPSNLSPEFSEWLSHEKTESVRHQRRIVKATAMLAFAVILFILKDNPEIIAGFLDLDVYVAK